MVPTTWLEHILCLGHPEQHEQGVKKRREKGEGDWEKTCPAFVPQLLREGLTVSPRLIANSRAPVTLLPWPPSCCDYSRAPTPVVTSSMNLKCLMCISNILPAEKLQPTGPMAASKLLANLGTHKRPASQHPYCSHNNV